MPRQAKARHSVTGLSDFGLVGSTLPVYNTFEGGQAINTAGLFCHGARIFRLPEILYRRQSYSAILPRAQLNIGTNNQSDSTRISAPTSAATVMSSVPTTRFDALSTFSLKP